MLIKIQHLLLLFSYFLLTSCSLLDYEAQSEIVGNISFLSGSIEVEGDQNSPIYIVLLKQHDTHWEVLNQYIVNHDRDFNFGLYPGKYIIGAYIDENRSHTKDNNESLSFYTQEGKSRPEVISFSEGEHVTVENFKVKNLVGEKESIIVSLPKIRENIGKITSLDNPMFAKENSTMGLWQPLTFLDTVGGGLFMLQPYSPDKTPILFVHGISGNPREFRDLIESLDTDIYQPWVLYYPSGFQLDVVSNYLLSSLNQLKSEYGFSDIHLIAHSMGGLMSRSFLMDHQKKKAKFDISLYMTINSPLNGLDSARTGVNSSPIVIASWRDLATNSDYIKKVHNWHIPKHLEYHLIFSYLPDEEGDGVVPMTSQLSLSLQDEATKIYGFQAGHAGVLKEDEFVVLFNKILSENRK